jgi:GntR family transcriptional regulator
MMIKNVNHQLLHLQVRRLLLKSIIQGEFAAAHMLPTEAELCTHLGVSRSTLRHAVTSLEQEGYLHRRQGLGTIIDRNVCSVTARFDLNSEFSILLNDLGYKPSVRFIDAREETASAGVAGLLKTQEGAALLSITKLWLADDRPAIWCTDSIPTALIIKSAWAMSSASLWASMRTSQSWHAPPVAITQTVCPCCTTSKSTPPAL